MGNKDRMISFRANDDDSEKLSAITSHLRKTKLDRNWTESEVIRHVIDRTFQGLPKEK